MLSLIIVIYWPTLVFPKVLAHWVRNICMCISVVVVVLFFVFVILSYQNAFLTEVKSNQFRIFRTRISDSVCKNLCLFNRDAFNLVTICCFCFHWSATGFSAKLIYHFVSSYIKHNYHAVIVITQAKIVNTLNHQLCPTDHESWLFICHYESSWVRSSSSDHYCSKSWFRLKVMFFSGL